jgi:glycosyltransferase involved in cell wall biosynthesis
MNSKTALAEANAMLRRGDFISALEAYKKLRQQVPALTKIIDQNIDFINRRIADTSDNAASTTLLTPPAARPEDIFIRDLYESVAESIRSGAEYTSAGKTESQPLITIVVTSHNVEDYIEHCLMSLYNQSYKNKEILIIDDCSSDRTVEIAQRVSKAVEGMRVIQLNANLGTYYAKNVGIKKSRGEIIFFQDSDDFSHPERLSILVRALTESAALVVRGAYSRFDIDTNRVIRVNGLVSKLGLITLGIRKTVFRDIGYFNCTTKASDEEFFHRFLYYFGKPDLVDVPYPLYYNTVRENSLFSDMVTWTDDGSIEQKPSPSRSAYVADFNLAHSNMDSDKARTFFSFPRLRDAIPVLPDMTKLTNPKIPVILNVCSIPKRESVFEYTIRSVCNQCDEINVYLDGYDHIPDYLVELGEKVNVYRSQDLPGLRDNGKFICLEKIAREKRSAYYFTIDDDIVYPDDYVHSMIIRLRHYSDAVVVGVHGVLLKDRPKGYFSDERWVYYFSHGLETDKLVNVLGTGTVAFHSDIIGSFTLREMESAGMADLYFAKMAKSRGLAFVCLRRPESWLIESKLEDTNSLFNEFFQSDAAQGKLIRENGPWGYEAIANIVSCTSSAALAGQLGAALHKMTMATKSGTSS